MNTDANRLEVMPRFTLKEMLLATTLIAIGAGLIAILFRYGAGIVEGGGSGGFAVALVLWLGGGALIGAGLFTPFKRPWTGVCVAVAIQFVLLAIPV